MFHGESTDISSHPLRATRSRKPTGPLKSRNFEIFNRMADVESDTEVVGEETQIDAGVLPVPKPIMQEEISKLSNPNKFATLVSFFNENVRENEGVGYID